MIMRIGDLFLENDRIGMVEVADSEFGKGRYRIVWLTVDQEANDDKIGTQDELTEGKQIELTSLKMWKLS